MSPVTAPLVTVSGSHRRFPQFQWVASKDGLFPSLHCAPAELHPYCTLDAAVSQGLPEYGNNNLFHTAFKKG